MSNLKLFTNRCLVEILDANMVFKKIKACGRMGGHELAPVKKQNRWKVRKYSFSQRTMN